MSERTQRAVVLGLIAAIVILIGWLVMHSESAPIVPATLDWGDEKIAVPDRAPSSSSREEQAGAPAAPAPRPPENGFIEIKVVAGGAPQEGAQVRLFRRGERDPNTAQLDWHLEGTGTTQANGSVRLPARSGAYLAVARKDGAGQALAVVQHPLGEPVSSARLELRRGVPLSGRAQIRGTHEPVPLAQIVCIPSIDPARVPAGWPPAAAEAPPELAVRAQADARGEFVVGELFPGTWQVEASAPGAGRAVLRGLAVPHAGPLLLELVAASYLEGHVLDAQGKPAAHAEITARGPFGSERATSSDAGAFSVEVVPGAWIVSARRGSEAGAVPHSIPVAEGKTSGGIELRLGPGASFAGKVVHKSDSAPLAGARVLVSPHDADGDSARALSAADGSYTAEGLAPGSYDVVVELEGYRTEERRGVALAAGQRFELQFALGGTGAVEGIVHDPSGHPIEGASVEGTAERSTPPTARTDRSGAYRLVGIASGHAQLFAHRSGVRVGVEQGVAVAEGETAHADFTLAETGHLSGRVTRAVGALPDGAVEVFAWRVSATTSPNDRSVALVNPDGSYEMELPAGSYRVRASGGGVSSEREGLSVEAGASIAHDFVLPEGGGTRSLIVTVLEPGGAPSPNALVWVRLGDSHGPYAATGQTDANGQLTAQLSGDADGALFLSSSNGGRAGSASAEEGASSATVQLAPAATLHGRLTGGTPPQGFTLDVSPSDDTYLVGGGHLTFLGDQFEIDQISPAPLKLRATTNDGRSGDATATTRAGQDTEVDIGLTPSTGLFGRAVDAKGAPIAQAMLTLDGNARTFSDSSGAFRFDGLTQGGHHISGEASPALTANLDVQAVRAQQVDVGDVTFTSQTAPPGAVGISLRASAGGVFIASVIVGSPADLAGLLLGDQISAIDGTPTASLTDAIARIRGEPGTPVSLTIVRGPRTLFITVVRAS